MASVHRGVTPEVHVPVVWKSYDFAGHAEGGSNGIPHQSLFVLSYLRIFGAFTHLFLFPLFFLTMQRVADEPKRCFFTLYLNN